MSGGLTAAEIAAMRATVAGDGCRQPGFLSDTVAVQTVAYPTTYTGTVPTYTTDAGRDAVPCELGAGKLVERTVNGITVAQTEYTFWFAVGTEPARTKALLLPDGTRLNVVEVAPVTGQTVRVRVQAARVGGTT